MLAENLLEAIGFTLDEQKKYFEIRSIIGDCLDEYAKSYMNNEITFQQGCEIAFEKFGDIFHRYTTDLMFVLECTSYLSEKYKEKNIPQHIFTDTMKDIKYKLDECMKLKKIYGTFVATWLAGFFDSPRYAIGRLQYDVHTYSNGDVEINGFPVRDGDTILKCHIPSSGPLKPEMYMESYKMAYEYFADVVKDGKLAILCYSWLLYPPYLKVFKEDTNTGKFIRDFEVIQFKEEDVFQADWRIFNMSYDGSVDKLPSDTSMQRGFIDYIKNGGTFGSATGIMLFDGKKCLTKNHCE